MRITRAFIAGVALVASTTHAAAGQANRQFSNAWFWGAKVGGLGYAKQTSDPNTIDSGYGQAPLVGVDWLITRTHGGLYASFSQSFFSQQTAIISTTSAIDTTIHPVDLKNARQFEMAMVAFPGTHLTFHPYIGLGFSLRSLGTASVQGPFASIDDAQSADAFVQNSKAAITPMVLLGGQRRYSWGSAFAQTTLGTSDRNWLLYNGNSLNYSYEIGIRYNVGTSIAR